MNAAQDWDVIWKWQWFRRPLWEPHFRDPAHPEGRVAKTTSLWDHLLKQCAGKRILDCNCGLGQRAILLGDLGYQVTGTDASVAAITGAKELASTCKSDVDFHVVSVLELADRYEPEFDAVIFDGFSSVLARNELRFAAHNIASLLKPGGLFLFTGADEGSDPSQIANQVEHAWQAAPRFQLRSDFEHEGTHLTLIVARDREEFGVVENYLFVVRDEKGTQLQTANICTSLKWQWSDYQHVCREAGFTKLETLKAPLGRREHLVNAAHR